MKILQSGAILTSEDELEDNYISFFWKNDIILIAAASNCPKLKLSRSSVFCFLSCPPLCAQKGVTAQHMQGVKADSELCCDLLQVLAIELLSLQSP